MFDIAVLILLIFISVLQIVTVFMLVGLLDDSHVTDTREFDESIYENNVTKFQKRIKNLETELSEKQLEFIDEVKLYTVKDTDNNDMSGVEIISEDYEIAFDERHRR